MQFRLLAGVLLTVALAVPGAASSAPKAPSIGLFEAQADVGATRIPGAVVYDAKADSYRVTGGGANMWGGVDAFHFVWKRASGDISLATDVAWIGSVGDPHRKGGVIIRQSLAPDSPYVDVVVHGNGLVSLQYRETPGGETHEIISNVTAPKRIGLEREGDYVYMSVSGPDGALHPAGGSFRLRLTGPYYVGLGVTAHDDAVSQTAVFSHVEIAPLRHAAGATPVLESTLETLDIASTDRRVIYQTTDHIEAPNWSRDGTYVVFNRDGQLWRLPIGDGVPALIPTGPLHKLNNDHGISPDGGWLMVSDQSEPDNLSRIYTLPIDGSQAPRLVASDAKGRSYWHGWSPDGKTIAYTASRPDVADDYDLFVRSVDGGPERRLEKVMGLDDGPDYSVDGKSIYFNSVRSGGMKIWRMDADGANPRQITFGDSTRDWFPHPSPDGKWIAFVTFGTDVAVGDHPANKDIELRIMPAGGGEPRVLAKLFGGQGTMNVPSWSPDSKHIAFVSYRLVTP
jgi:TolB protein